MKILIDTHALLWFFLDDARLSKKAKAVYLDVNHQLFVSTASLWEICIKHSLGKLKLRPNWFLLFMHQIQQNSIQWLSIIPEHCHQVSLLPFLHRDPFDRMLVAQSLVEEMQVLTQDASFKLYGVESLW